MFRLGEGHLSHNGEKYARHPATLHYNTSMSLSRFLGRRMVATSLFGVCLFALQACNKSNHGAQLGTFRMGERVEAGSLVYTVVDAQWPHELAQGAKAPQHRYLRIRVSVTNGGSNAMEIPPFELEGTNGTRIQEVTDGLGSLEGRLGMLRSVQPAQTEQGIVVFDAPMQAYKLVLSDGGDLEKERHALVDIPVNLE